eukprot:3129047-Prymnesium_polylepis.1
MKDALSRCLGRCTKFATIGERHALAAVIFDRKEMGVGRDEGVRGGVEQHIAESAGARRQLQYKQQQRQ